MRPVIPVRWHLTLFFALLFQIAGTAAAQESSAPLHNIQVRADILPNEMTVADLSTYKISIEAPENLQPEPPALDQFKGFELVDQGATSRPLTGGKVHHEFWYRLRADQVGYHTLPGTEIKFQSRDGSFDGPPIQTPDVKAQIRSVLYKDGKPEDIHDIKPIIGAAWPWKKYFWPVVGGLLLALLVGYLAQRWVEKRRIRARPPVEKTVPPQELALRELQGLFDKGLLNQGRFREHYYELSEIYRRYLGLRFDIPALDWTTEEIGRSLDRQTGITSEVRALALHLLHETDLIKFAKAPVEENAAIEHMKSIRDFIKATGTDSKPADSEKKTRSSAVVAS